MRNGLGTIVILAALAVPALADDPVNVASFANGGLIESSTSDYPGWEADYLLDESTDRGWASRQNSKPPFVIVISLAEKSAIQSVAFDNGEDGAGRAAKDVDVAISDTSATAGFTLLLTATLKEKVLAQRFALKTPATGRWLRLTIRSNFGAADYYELMDFRAYGRMLGHAPAPTNLSGTYHSGEYGNFHLLQKGAELTGCYEYNGTGLVHGGLESHLMRLTWSEHGNSTGPALMVLRRNGRDFKGWWRHDQDKAWHANWDLVRTSDTVGSCAGWNPSGNAIASELARQGRSRLYGINFDLDSATLRADARPEIEELVSVLKADPKLRLSIEGHTDSTGTPAHNLDLSKRRAEAVMAQLAAAGIAPSRMTAAGYGQSKPVAGNDSEIGRAQNRRVEAVRQ